jgi:autotransporter-associated beta strand protein
VNTTRAALVYTWTGGAANGDWFQSTNWQGNVVPAQSGATELVFTSSLNGIDPMNGSIPFVLGRITFGGASFTLTGSTIQLGSDGFTSASIVQNSDNPQIIRNGLTIYNDTTIGGSGLGSITFAAPISGSPFASLTDNSNTLFSGGRVTVYSQAYSGTITLGADTTFASTSSGNIAFNSRIDGAFALVAATQGVTTFGSAVGTTPLASLRTGIFGSTAINGGAVTTSGYQFYQNAVSLGSDTTLTAASGFVELASTLDGAHALVVNSPAAASFDLSVGGTTPLLSLTTDAPGKTTIGRDVTTTGAQTYNDPVTLGGNSILKSTGGSNITFAASLDGFMLTVNTSGTTTFGGPVGSVTPLTSMITDSAGLTFINGGSVRSTGAQIYNDAVVLGKDTTLIASGGGYITLGNGVNGAVALSLSTAGKTTLIGPVGANIPLASLTVAPGGSTSLNAATVTSTGGQSYGSPVTLGAATTLTSTTPGGDIAFGSTISGANFPLAVHTAGAAIFGGSVDASTLTVDASSGILIGGDVTTRGPQTFNDSVTLSGRAILSVLNSGSVKFAKVVDGAFPLLVHAGGGTTFSGAVGGSTPLTSLDGGVIGVVAINGGSVTTTGPQNYSSVPVTLGAATILKSSGAGSVSFGKTLNGPFPLEIDTAGTTTFNGVVGATGPLNSLTTDAPGATEIGASITTSGNQIFNDAVTINHNVTLTSTGGGDIVFSGPVKGPSALSIKTDGALSFGSEVGSGSGLSALTIAAGDANGGAVTAGLITQSLASGTTTFTGLLHATSGGISLSGNQFALAGLQSDASGILIANSGAGNVNGAIAGPVDFTKTGAGTLTLSGSNTYSGVTTVSGGTLKVSSTIASSAQVTVNNNGTFEAAAGQTVKALTINDGGKVVVSADALKVGINLPGNHLNIATAPPGFGILDLTTHGLIVDSAPAEAVTAHDNVRSLIINAFSGGTWLGAGITSSNAQSDPTKAVGYALASEVLGAAGGAFLDVPTDGSGALARYTFLGDANLDGAVGFPDLVKLAQNYNGTNKFWFDGDFNYDGTVDFADLVKLAQNYNAALPTAPLPGASATFNSDLQAAFAGAAPEPNTACWLSLATLLFARRGRLSAPHARIPSSGATLNPPRRDRSICPEFVEGARPQPVEGERRPGFFTAPRQSHLAIFMFHVLPPGPELVEGMFHSSEAPTRCAPVSPRGESVQGARGRADRPGPAEMRRLAARAIGSSR